MLYAVKAKLRKCDRVYSVKEDGKIEIVRRATPETGGSDEE